MRFIIRRAGTQCKFCNAPLGLSAQLRNGEFCSAEHRESYRQLMFSKVRSRIGDEQAVPAAMGPIVELPAAGGSVPRTASAGWTLPRRFRRPGELSGCRIAAGASLETGGLASVHTPPAAAVPASPLAYSTATFPAGLVTILPCPDGIAASSSSGNAGAAEVPMWPEPQCAVSKRPASFPAVPADPNSAIGLRLSPFHGAVPFVAEFACPEEDWLAILPDLAVGAAMPVIQIPAPLPVDSKSVTSSQVDAPAESGSVKDHSRKPNEKVIVMPNPPAKMVARTAGQRGPASDKPNLPIIPLNPPLSHPLDPRDHPCAPVFASRPFEFRGIATSNMGREPIVRETGRHRGTPSKYRAAGGR